MQGLIVIGKLLDISRRGIDCGAELSPGSVLQRKEEEMIGLKMHWQSIQRTNGKKHLIMQWACPDSGSCLRLGKLDRSFPACDSRQSPMDVGCRFGTPFALFDVY